MVGKSIEAIKPASQAGGLYLGIVAMMIQHGYYLQTTRYKKKPFKEYSHHKWLK